MFSTRPPPKDIDASVILPSQVIVYRQNVDSSLRGYTVTVGGQPVTSYNLTLDHQTIDDGEPVHRYVVNSLQPQLPLPTPDVNLQYSITSISSIFGGYIVHGKLVNTGGLIADDIAVTQATLSGFSSTAALGNTILKAGESTTIDIQFQSLLLHSGTTTLTLFGKYSNYAWGGSARVSLP